MARSIGFRASLTERRDVEERIPVGRFSWIAVDVVGGASGRLCLTSDNSSIRCDCRKVVGSTIAATHQPLVSPVFSFSRFLVLSATDQPATHAIIARTFLAADTTRSHVCIFAATCSQLCRLSISLSSREPTTTRNWNTKILSLLESRNSTNFIRTSGSSTTQFPCKRNN